MGADVRVFNLAHSLAGRLDHDRVCGQFFVAQRRGFASEFFCSRHGLGLSMKPRLFAMGNETTASVFSSRINKI